jgi:hypothetical protein
MATVPQYGDVIGDRFHLFKTMVFSLSQTKRNTAFASKLNLMKIRPLLHFSITLWAIEAWTVSSLCRNS